MGRTWSQYSRWTTFLLMQLMIESWDLSKVNGEGSVIILLWICKSKANLSFQLRAKVLKVRQELNMRSRGWNEGAAVTTQN